MSHPGAGAVVTRRVATSFSRFPGRRRPRRESRSADSPIPPFQNQPDVSRHANQILPEGHLPDACSGQHGNPGQTYRNPGQHSEGGAQCQNQIDERFLVSSAQRRSSSRSYALSLSELVPSLRPLLPKRQLPRLPMICSLPAVGSSTPPRNCLVRMMLLSYMGESLASLRISHATKLGECLRPAERSSHPG